MRWGWYHPISRPVAAGVFLLTLMALAAMFLPLTDMLLAFLSWIRSLGWRGVSIFLAVYTIAVLLALPSSVLTIAAGVIFGGIRGFIISTIGCIAGGVLAFLLAKHLATGLRERLRRHEQFRVIEGSAREDGLRLVILMRLSPLFPYGIINYGLGLARVRTRDYVLGTLLGNVPGLLLYTIVGSAAKSLAAAVAGRGPDAGPVQYAIYIGLVLTVAATVALTWWARKRLFQRLDEEEQELRLSGEIPIPQ